MKSTLFILLAILCFSAFAQPIKIAGKLINVDKLETANLSNFAQKDIPIKVNKDGSFSSTITDLKSGVYQLPEVGDVYLEPGFDLIIKPNKDSNYEFSGKGSLENNLMLDSKKLIKNYFQMGENGFLFSIYLIEPDTFLLKLDSFKNNANILIDKSTSDNFKTIAKGDIDFYCRNLLGNYAIYYGTDSLKQENYYRFISDSIGKVSPARMIAAMQ